MAGEKVLFLCYNSQLKNYLSENYPHESIDYYTISGYACKLCDSTVPKYDKMESILEEMYIYDTFPYMHVIIDEGQDFGIEDMEEANVVELLKTIIVDRKPETASFYIFYDKLQLVQASQAPKYIDEADCKLTLYRNCRNTENIATTSLAPITERKPKLIDGCVKGAPAKLHFCSNSDAVQEKLNLLLDTLKGQGVKDIIILTCKTETTSILSNVIINGVYAGFATWWVPYLYIWAILWGLTMLLPRKMPKWLACILYPAVCSLYGFAYGTLYAPAQALLFGFNFEQTLAWIVAGIPFDVIHGVSNLFAGLLVLPLSSLLVRLKSKYIDS